MFISSWEWGVMKHLWDFVQTRYPQLYRETLALNFKDDPGIEILGLSDPAVLWIANWHTALHHGTAGALMLAGMYMESPALWRHGLLTQLSGMDVADFLRMLWAKLFPPGPFPIGEAIKQKGYVAFMLFHHSVSLLAGLPVCFYFAHDARFQWMGALMAGGPLLSVVWDLPARCMPHSYRSFHILSQLYCTGVFLHQRVVLYFPLAYSLLSIAYEAADVPTWAKLSLLLGGVNMSMFNLICCGLMVYDWGKKMGNMKTKPSEDQTTVEPVMSAQAKLKCTLKCISALKAGNLTELSALALTIPELRDSHSRPTVSAEYLQFLQDVCKHIASGPLEEFLDYEDSTEPVMDSRSKPKFKIDSKISSECPPPQKAEKLGGGGGSSCSASGIGDATLLPTILTSSPTSTILKKERVVCDADETSCRKRR
jgi:hypothetical protein